MNLKLFFIAVAAALLAGCATPSKMAKMEGQGTKRIFPEPYSAVWKSAIEAARHGQLQIESIDETKGYIVSRTPVRMESWGERVGIWVKKIDDSHTSVEVVSRLVGPTDIWKYDWEISVLNNIAVDFNLPLTPVPKTVPTKSPHDS